MAPDDADANGPGVFDSTPADFSQRWDMAAAQEVVPAQTVTTTQPTPFAEQVAPSPARIAQVSIRRFKSIADLTIPLDDNPAVLVGANNSGKSSVLHAVHFAVSVAQTARLVGERVNWAADEFQLSFNPSQLLWSPVADVMSLATGGVLQESAPTQIEIELQDTDGDRCIVAVRRGRNRNIQVSLRGRRLGERLQSLEHPFSVYTPGLAGIARDEHYLSPGVVRRAVARGDANLVLRNVLLMLQDRSDKWEIFLSDIRSLFPDITFTVHFDADTDETIATTVSLDGGPDLPLDAAGTAILQASQILGYLALYNPPVILLDEPDSHLHPNNQRSLCNLLTRLSTSRGFRLLISTHSRHVLDALRSASTVVWMSQGAIVSDVNSTLTSRLLDLGALDSVDFFADGQTKCVVVTEDADTTALKALLDSCGFIEDDTRVASYAGCSKVEAATVLGQFIQQHANNIQILVHRDSDYMTTDEIDTYRSEITNCGLNPFLTEGSDIEWHFVNARHLAYLNRGITVEQIEQMITEAVLETADQSIAAMINVRTERAFRQQSRTGKRPDHGAISVQATKEFNANPRAFCRGKTVLGIVKSKLQRASRANPRVFEPSEHLICRSLADLASRIWPND